jgi:PAS domain S-box-containing protein
MKNMRSPRQGPNALEKPFLSPADLFQAWAETAPEIFFVVEPSLRLSYINPFAARMLKKKPQALIGKHLKELFPPEDFKIQRRNLRRVFSTGSSHYHEDWIHFSGNALWLGVRLVPLRDPQEKIQAVFGVARDYTTRKSLETTLQDSEKKYRRLTEQIPGVVYLASGKTPGELVYVSPRIQELLGFTPEEWLSDWRLWLKRIHPEDRQRVVAAAARAVQTGTPFQQEYRLLHRKGDLVWIYDQAHPVKDEAGRLLYFHGVNVDITPRKKAEAALIQAEERYRQVLENADEAILVIQDGWVKFCNPKSVAISGYSVTEQMGRPFIEFIDPDSRDLVLKNHQRRLARKKSPTRYEIRFRHKDGHTLFIQLNAKVISWDNRPASLVFATDITEKKLTQEALRESEGRYRILFEATEDGVVITSEEGRILALNRAGRRLFGIPPRADLKKLKVVDFYANPRDRQTYVETMKRKGFVSNYEIDYRKTDGSQFTGTLTATLQKGSEGRPIFMGIIRDITQRKRHELELRQSRRELRNLSEHLHALLEEEKKRISRRIHDELGQQLTAFKMDLYWLNRHFFDQPSLLGEKIGSMSQVLDNTIHTVQNLCEELRPALLDNLGLIDALEWQINNFRERTGLEILWDVSPRNLKLPQEDATLIFRLFQEALNNIFLHARASRVIIALKKSDNLLKLNIRDNGLGITEAQIKSPRSFGLLGMRERVDARGGKIIIRGLAGKGTEVAIQIPLSKKEQRHD